MEPNTNRNTANDLNKANQDLQKAVPNMIKAAREAADKPENSTAQQGLIHAAEDFFGPAHKETIYRKIYFILDDTW